MVNGEEEPEETVYDEDGEDEEVTSLLDQDDDKMLQEQ